MSSHDSIISVFEFRDLFQNARSAAIIGNAPSLLEWNNGELIDSYDMVVRFNRATTKGLEEKVGSKTGLLFVNTGQARTKSQPPCETLRPTCVACLVPPTEIAGFDPTQLLDWCAGSKLFLSFSPDLYRIPSLSRCRPLTNGTYALYLILTLFNVRRLFVSGFTFHGMVPGGTGKYWGTNQPQPQWSHELDQEAKIFSALIQGFPGETKATPDVASILKKHGVHIPCSSDLVASVSTPKSSLTRRVADGLGWRLIRAGSYFRRIAEVS